jgi:hypothetical protein
MLLKQETFKLLNIESTEITMRKAQQHINISGIRKNIDFILLSLG